MPHINPWFPAAKFGIFIHWTLTGTFMDDPSAEHPRTNEQKRARAKKFTADQFDAKCWARMFKRWGARYAVLTTKHHIGFALFDCPVSRFTAAKSSPAGRDLVAEYVEAMRSEGLKVGLYYSLPDWTHPDYASCAGGDDREKFSEHDEPERWNRFIEDMFAEVHHLCTAYGKIDLLWFDGDWERTAEQWHSLELAAMIEELQPGIVLNNRLRHKNLGHYGTPESAAPAYPPGGVWEYCTTPGDNWDGPLANRNVKQPPELVRMFGDTIGMGGNLLLNMAPYSRGVFPEVQVNAVSGLGEWITAHRSAIYGSEAGLPPALFNGASTHHSSVIDLIAYDQPRDELVVKGIRGNIARVAHLVSGTELAWRRSGGRENFNNPGWLYITLPADLVEPLATVVRIEFENDACEVQMPNGWQKWTGRPAFDESPGVSP